MHSLPGAGMATALWRYRKFIARHAWADLRHRYTGTGMGIVWNVIHPLAMIAIYSLVFSSIMHVELPGFSVRASYALYLCSGLFPWMAFSDCIMRGCTAFLVNASYLKKIPIPEPVFVAQSAVSSAISLGVNFSLVLLIAWILGYPPTWRWLLLPAPFVCLLTLGFGFGLLLGTLNVFFRDIAELTGIVLQVVMWTAPIVYVADKLAMPGWLKTAMMFHPVVPLLSAVRDLFLFQHNPSAATWASMICWPIGIVAVAGLVLNTLRSDIRDVI